MPSNQQQAVMECGCCGGCPCCPGWPLTASGSIRWTTVSDASDCGGGAVDLTGDFGCLGTPENEIGTLLNQDSTYLYVRVWCDYTTTTWHVQYRSGATGSTGTGDCEGPASTTWQDVDFTFVCPDCADAVGGIATGTIDFIAIMCCEISGPAIVNYNVTVHADVEIGCP
tara:strand:+ start:480 stop:986 length:507 start_codon:yes stop_codon:yes gene_type:complete